MSDSSIWDSDRISRVQKLQNAYFDMVEEGMTIRLGFEGEPCYPFKRVEDAPTGIVTHVYRGNDQESEITVRMHDGTGAYVNLSAGMIGPKKVFEVLPNHEGTSNDETLEIPQEEGADEPRNDMSADFRGIMDEMKNINTKVQDIEHKDNDFISTMTSTVRFLAADIILVSQGKPLEFSQHYSDKYDSFRGSDSTDRKSRSSLRHTSHQTEKTDFAPLQYYESSVLTS